MTSGPQYFIGLMTGTSVDAVDAALVRFSSGGRFELHTHIGCDIPPELTAEIISLFTPGPNEIERLGQVDVQLSQLYSTTVHALLKKARLDKSQICAIGSHGQTIRHRPNNSTPFTLQIGDPNTLSALTGIPTIADFRRKDIALGGQGAPLAPAFHHHLCAQAAYNQNTLNFQPCALLNIGGIANVSLIQSGNLGETTGFDTGPGNGLMDAWVSLHRNLPYDNNGEWARSGTVDTALLQSLLAHDYFQKSPPKSTGKEEFTLAWVQQILRRPELSHIHTEDVQATLCEFTARTIAEPLTANKDLHQIYICGGGAHNTYLLERLAQYLNTTSIHTTEHLGVHPDWVEAVAFAWLAFQSWHQLPGNITTVTGASRPAILGGIYYP